MAKNRIRIRGISQLLEADELTQSLVNGQECLQFNVYTADDSENFTRKLNSHGVVSMLQGRSYYHDDGRMTLSVALDYIVSVTADMSDESPAAITAHSLSCFADRVTSLREGSVYHITPRGDHRPAFDHVEVVRLMDNDETVQVLERNNNYILSISAFDWRLA